MRYTHFAIILASALQLLATSAFAQPANDNICNATILPLENGACEAGTVYSWSGATFSSASGLPYCYNVQTKDVWFRVTVPASGQVRVATTDNGFDIAVEVWKGTACGSAAVLNQNTDGFPCIYTSRPTSAPPAQTYKNLTPGSFVFLRAFAFNENISSASLKLCVSDPLGVADEPCNAGFLPVSPGDPLGQTCLSPQTFTYSGATLTAGIPNPDCISSLAPSNIRDVWMKIRVPANGKLVIQAPYINAYYALQVLSANACNGTFTQVTCALGSPISLSSLTPNNILYLRIFRWSNSIEPAGTFKICAEARNDLPPINNIVGRVGIGIDTPFTKLHVVGSGFFNDKVIAGSDVETRGNLIVAGSIISSSGNTKIETPNLNVTGTATLSGNSSFTAPASFSRLTTFDSIGFTTKTGPKISMYGSMQGAHYGIGIQGGLLQVYTDAAAANIAFGYGSSSNFNERARIINQGEFGMTLTGRLQLRTGTQSAGLWLNNAANTTSPAFIGLANDNQVGFYSSFGAAWGLTMNTTTGNVGIGLNGAAAQVPLQFSNALGLTKISLYRGTYGDVGIGVYGGEMRLQNDIPGGKVSMGVLETTGDFTELAKAQRNGAYAFSIFGSLWANGTTYASDGRFKKNIEPLQESLDKVLQLQGVSYEMKADEFPKEHFDTGTQVGLIAQDVEKIVPEVVTEGPNGYKAIDYAKLVPLLIESIKAQQAMLQKQQEEIDALKKNKRFRK